MNLKDIIAVASIGAVLERPQSRAYAQEAFTGWAQAFRAYLDRVYAKQAVILKTKLESR